MLKNRDKIALFERCFILIYYIIALFLYAISLPYLLYLSFKDKYKESIPARFFLYKNSFFNKNDIWFHACSLGEVKSLQPIIDHLGTDVNISVITNTGYNEAKKLSESVKFLPFEIFQPFWQKRQKVLIVLEAELWYMLFLIAKNKGAKTILLNARISDNSYNSYKKFAFFYKLIFKHIDEVFAQSEKDKKRLKELGANSVKVVGNIKSFSSFKITKKLDKPKDSKLVVLSSTHSKEEKLILQNIDIKKGMKIVVVPRHPERFEEVDEYLQDFSKDKNLTYSRYTSSQNFESDITLCDKMGELINIYAICDIVLLCGSFVDNIGGHNPLEPAYFNLPIISGKYFFNQQTLYDMVENIYIADKKDINSLLDKDLKKSYIKDKIDIKPIIESIKSVV